MNDLARLVLRVTVGGLLAGHGAQKLFGAFRGPGVEGTARMMESIGLRPARAWARLAAAAEFGGGLLTALGALGPLGPIGILSAMTMATVKVHAGKPIWASAGGAELPVTNMAAALALALSGPGRYSVDEALGLRLRPPVAAAAALAAAAGLAAGTVGPRMLPARAESRPEAA